MTIRIPTKIKSFINRQISLNNPASCCEVKDYMDIFDNGPESVLTSLQTSEIFNLESD